MILKLLIAVIVVVFLVLIGRNRNEAVSLNLSSMILPKETDMLPVIMTETQQVTLSIAPTDRNGEPAEVQNIEWGTESTLVTLAVSEDGLSCVVTTVGEPGECLVSVSADADLGEGVVSITSEASIIILNDLASALNLTASAPQFYDV